MSVARLMERARVENHLCSVLLELTYACNLDCQFCYNDLSTQGRRLELDDYRRLLDELADMGALALTLSGGEPLVHPDFFAIGAHARALGFAVTVKSNGVPLSERNALRLKAEVDPYLVEMSLHGACAETHEQQTRQAGSFERMVANIRRMKTMGFRMRLNSALTRLNEEEVSDMFALADELGVPLRFDPDITPKDDGDLSPLLLTASDAGKKRMFRLTAERALASRPATNRPVASLPIRPPGGPEVTQKPTRQKNCGAGSTSLAVDPFGNVYPCVQFRRRVGNVHQDSVRSIWEESRELERIRTLAYAAHEQAMANGMDSYCMGSSELLTGDPLIVHPELKRNADIQKQVNRALLDSPGAQS